MIAKAKGTQETAMQELGKRNSSKCGSQGKSPHGTLRA